MTAGYIASTNVNLFLRPDDHASGVRLPGVFQAQRELPGQRFRGLRHHHPDGTRLGRSPVLILIVLILNLIGRLVAKIFAVKSER